MQNASDLLQPSGSSGSLGHYRLIVIPGTAVPAPRPRLGKGRVFMPKAYTSAKTHAAFLIRKAWAQGMVPRDEPVFMLVTFVYKALRKKDIGKFRMRKPDLDNLAKTVMDAATVARVYDDDSQVVDKRVRKMWGVRSETRVEIWTEAGCRLVAPIENKSPEKAMRPVHKPGKPRAIHAYWRKTARKKEAAG